MQFLFTCVQRVTPATAQPSAAQPSTLPQHAEPVNEAGPSTQTQPEQHSEIPPTEPASTQPQPQPLLQEASTKAPNPEK